MPNDRTPHAPQRMRQIGTNDYGIQVARTTGSTTSVATFGRIYATGTPPVSRDVQTQIMIASQQAGDEMEYWYLDAALVADLENTSYIHFSSAPLLYGTTGNVNYVPPSFNHVAVFTCSQLTTWEPVSGVVSVPNSTSIFFQSSPDMSADYVCMQIILDDARNILGIYWYQATQDSLTPSGTLSRVPSVTLSGDMTWYASNTPPQYAIQSGQKPGWFLGLASGITPANNTPVTLQPFPTRWQFDATKNAITLAADPSLALQSNGAGEQLTVSAHDASNASQSWSWQQKEYATISTSGPLFIENSRGALEQGNPIVADGQAAGILANWRLVALV